MPNKNPAAKTSLSSAGFSERYAEAIYTKPARAIFINPFDMARPGQIKDGYFPDAVFADPRYVMPRDLPGAGRMDQRPADLC